VLGSEIEILELPQEPALDADGETWEERA